jgi:AcrR family transcriptional regulator
MPKIVDHVRYRARLVERSVNLFAERGYASLGMRDIARALDVSTGTLYHYFDSKEALFDAVVSRVSEQDLSAVVALSDTPNDPRIRLHALFHYVAENEDRFAQEVLVLLEFRRANRVDSERRDVIRTAADAYVAAINAFLGIDDLALARLVLVVLDGLLIQRVLDARKTPLLEQLDRIERLLPPAPIAPTPKRKK